MILGGAACCKMSEPNVKECVRMLITISFKSFHAPVSRIVTDNSSECACGWKLADGRPEYICTSKARRKKYPNSTPSRYNLCKSSITLDAATTSTDTDKMGGKLTESLDYEYVGGLSNRVRGSESPAIPLEHPSQPVQYRTFTLNPVLENRSDSMTETSRVDLSRLVQMQLRPDITYEQMIIEQRLRAMNLAINSQPSLSITSLNKQSSTKPSVHTQSISEPPMQQHHPNNMHVKKQTATHRNKKTLRPIKWCSLTHHRQIPAFAKQSEDFRSSFSRLLQRSSHMMLDKH